ncbi:hypothetical protein BCV26_001860 [Vibrio cyclitrophicus]|uniref:hypothetical protein n=1 Tax=Vibrio cyclitrophicus TaxID=47951 RepID=UPI0038B4DCF6
MFKLMLFFKVSYKTIYSLGLRLISIASSFLMSFLVARLFNIETSGVVFFFLSLVSIIVVLSAKGFDVAISKITAENSDLSISFGYLGYVFFRIIPFCTLLTLLLYISPILIECYFDFKLYNMLWGTDFRSSFLLILFIFVSNLMLHIMSFYFQGLSMLTMTVLCQRTLFNIFLCCLFSVGLVTYNEPLSFSLALNFIGLSSFICLSIVALYFIVKLGFLYKPVDRKKDSIL